MTSPGAKSLPASSASAAPGPVAAVQVTAASRLHFGLLSWGGPARQYGGVGLMVERPEVRLRVAVATQFTAQGPHAERLAPFGRQWQMQCRAAGLATIGSGDVPAVRCDVLAAPPQHSGLGVGTQLGLSLGAALYRLAGQPLPDPAELARSVGRGLRSAVGTYGFYLGGLIVEWGKQPGELLAPLALRRAVPADWRFVMVCPAGAAGTAGEAELQAFANLPPVPIERTERLVAIIERQMLPALDTADCAAFGAAMYEYGRLAGESFAPCQGGPFNGPRLTRLVELLRGWGVAGVAQSSWGPTLLALCPDAAAARQLVERLDSESGEPNLQLEIAAAANHGATIEVEA